MFFYVFKEVEARLQVSRRKAWNDIRQNQEIWLDTLTGLGSQELACEFSLAGMAWRKDHAGIRKSDNTVQWFV